MNLRLGRIVFIVGDQVIGVDYYERNNVVVVVGVVVAFGCC